MYLIDTCIFLEILLGQEKAERCEIFLEKVRKGEFKASISSFSLHTIGVILSRYKKISALELFMEDLLTFNNLEIIYTNIVDELKAVKTMRLLNLDFDDTIQYYVAKSRSLAIVTLDKDFNKTDLKIIQP